MGMLDTLIGIGTKLSETLKENKKIDEKTFKSIGKGLDNTSKVGQSFSAAFAQKSAFSAGGGLLGDAGDAAMSFGGPVGMVAGGGLKIAGAALNALPKLHEANQEALSQQFQQFGGLSPGMASVQSEQQRSQNRLGYEQGQALTDSARRLSEADQKLGRQMSSIDTWWGKFKNDGRETLTSFASQLLEAAGAGSGKEDKSKPTTITPDEWAATAAKKYQETVQRRPKRMR